MTLDVMKLLPPGMSGPRDLAFWIFVMVTVMGTLRSLIHLLAPDGGAASIAGLSLSGTYGANVVALFGQWGASQLVLAMVFWMVILRYRALVPLMWMVVVAEQLLRIVAGRLKPLTSSRVPPGAYGTYALLALSVGMLLCRLWHPS